MLHRVLSILLVALLLAGAAHADDHQEAEDPTCERTSDGYTCESTSRRSIVVEQGGVRVGLVDETTSSEGAHNGSSPNTWETSSRAVGVEVSAAGASSRAAVTQETYQATQWNEEETQRTDENGFTVGVYHSDLPGDYPRVSVAERTVDGGYHRCIVRLDGTVLASVPCGPEALDEPVPLP